MTNLCALSLAVLLCVLETSNVQAKSAGVLSETALHEKLKRNFKSGVGIIGGRNSTPGAWPWQLMLEQNIGNDENDSWEANCGAILLSGYYALTAAHCVDLYRPVDPKDLRVIAGMYWPTNYSNTQIAYIASYKVHEEWDAIDVGAGVLGKNDLAILKFTTPVKETKTVVFATLPAKASQRVGDTCVITGWGDTDPHAGGKFPAALQEANTTVISVNECQQLMRGPMSQEFGPTFNVTGGVWKNHICFLRADNTTGSCHGDSGGPANCPSCCSVSDAAAGITSWGDDDCSTYYPSVYTRVSAYLDWIRKNTPPVL